MNIGKSIKEKRKDKKMTQAELARAVRVSQSTIGKYETGENSPSYEMLEKIANVLECGLIDLLGVDRLKKGELLEVKTVSGLIKEVNTLSGQDAEDTIKQIELDADYFKRLAVPALQLNDTGRDLLLSDAEKYAKIKELTE